MATIRQNLDDKQIFEVKSLDVLTIIYKDVFNMKNLYEMMHEWVVEEGFCDDNGDQKDSFETFYWERRKPGSTGKDFNIWWRLKKDISPWWRYSLNVDFVGIHVEDTQIMYEGKKIKLNSGELDLFISPKLILDYNHLWKGGTLFDSFIRPFRLRLIKKEFSFHKQEMEDVAARLQATVKDFFALRQFEERGEPLHGRKGLDWD